MNIKVATNPRKRGQVMKTKATKIQRKERENKVTRDYVYLIMH